MLIIINVIYRDYPAFATPISGITARS